MFVASSSSNGFEQWATGTLKKKKNRRGLEFLLIFGFVFVGFSCLFVCFFFFFGGGF